MGAVTIHLPSEVEDGVRRASAEAGVSVSSWLADAAKKRLGARLPPSELVAVFGSVPEFELPTRKERWTKRET